MAGKKHLNFYIDEIDSLINEINQSGLDVLDENKAQYYVQMLNYYKKRWVNDVLSDKSGPNLLSKASIIYPVVEIQLGFRKYMSEIGKEKLRDKYSNEAITMFETLLNKDIQNDKDYENSMKMMLDLKDHIEYNPSKYNDIKDQLSDYVYRLFKKNIINNDKDCSYIDSSVFSIIKSKIIEEAKDIANQNYESKEQKEIQNEIRMYITLNDLDYEYKIKPLLKYILSINETATVELDEEEIIINDYEKFYEEILKELEDIKIDNYGLYTYSLLYIYYSKKDSIDNAEFYSSLKEVKQDLLKYKYSRENNTNFTKKQLIIKKINDSNKVVDNSVFDNYRYKSDFEKSVLKQYLSFENYKTFLVNGNDNFQKEFRSDNKNNLLEKLYTDNKNNIILFTDLILNGFYDDSILVKEDKEAILTEMGKIVESEEDPSSLWKLNSYIRLLFGKNPSYINLISKDKNFSTKFNCNISYLYDENVDLINNFYSNMILLNPIKSFDEFEKEFKRQLLETLNVLSQNKGASFQISPYNIYEYKKIIKDNMNNSYNNNNIYSKDNVFNPYFKDFLLINESYTYRQNPLKSSIKIKQLKPISSTNI